MAIVYVCQNKKCETQTRATIAGTCDTCNSSLKYTYEEDPVISNQIEHVIKDETSGSVAYVKGHLASLVPTFEDKVIVHIKKLASSDASYAPQTIGGHTCDHDSEKNGGNYQSIFYTVIAKGREINIIGLGNHKGSKSYSVVWEDGSKANVSF